MAEFICAIGATAAISQVVRYGFEIVTRISGLTHRARHTTRTLRIWNEHANSFVALVEAIQLQITANNGSLSCILNQCREEIIKIQSLMQRFSVIRDRGRLSRLRKTCLMLWSEKDIEAIISSLIQRSNTLQIHLIMLNTTRIEDRLLTMSSSSILGKQHAYVAQSQQSEPKAAAATIHLQHLDFALKAMHLSFPPVQEQLRLLGNCRQLQHHALSVLALTMENLKSDQLPASLRKAITSLCSKLCTFLLTTGQNQEVKATILKTFRWAAAITPSRQIDLKCKLAISEYGMGNLPTAEKVSREVLFARVRTLGDTHSKTLHSLSNLALVYQDQGLHVKASRYHRKVLATKEIEFGNSHPDTLVTVNNLGLSLLSQNLYQAAESLFHRSLSARLQIFPTDDLDLLTSQSNLGVAYQLQGKLPEAEQIHRSVLNGRLRVLGDTHIETLKSKGNLALTLADLGNPVQAETMLRSILPAYEQSLGNKNPDTIKTYENLAMILHDQSNFSAAETIITTIVLPSKQHLYGTSHNETLTTLEFLCILLQWQGKYQSAIDEARRVRDVRARKEGWESEDVSRWVGYLRDLEEDLLEAGGLGVGCGMVAVCA